MDYLKQRGDLGVVVFTSVANTPASSMVWMTRSGPSSISTSTKSTAPSPLTSAGAAFEPKYLSALANGSGRPERPLDGHLHDP